jgi:hypothetical protein
LKVLFLFLMLVFMLLLLIFHILALNLDKLVRNPWFIVKMDFGMKCLTMNFPSTMNILIVFLFVTLGIINLNTTSGHVFSNLYNYPIAINHVDDSKFVFIVKYFALTLTWYASTFTMEATKNVPWSMLDMQDVAYCCIRSATTLHLGTFFCCNTWISH